MIGLLVGGPTERTCYETLTKKLGISADVRIPGRPGGEDRLLDLRTVLNLCSTFRSRRLSKIVIVIDSECDPQGRRQASAERVLVDIHGKLSVDVSYFFVVCMLESWFLSDRTALRIFLRQAPGKLNPGTRQDKSILSRLVERQKGECIENRDWPKIAELVNVVELAELSQNFGEFRRTVS